jgi:hypothetical protein
MKQGRLGGSNSLGESPWSKIVDVISYRLASIHWAYRYFGTMYAGVNTVCALSEEANWNRSLVPRVAKDPRAPRTGYFET